VGFLRFALGLGRAVSSQCNARETSVLVFEEMGRRGVAAIQDENEHEHENKKL
jgi:hypothetical protein